MARLWESVFSDGVEFQVCWNGSHDGRDNDLMNDKERIPEKVYGRGGSDRRPQPARKIVMVALRELGPVTPRQLARKTNLPLGTVHYEISLLRDRKLVDWRESSHLTVRGRRQRVYWLRVLDAAATSPSPTPLPVSSPAPASLLSPA